ncbi:unnamed protein product [Musa banksii]
MASVPICSPLSCKDQIQVAKKVLMQIGRDSVSSCLSCHKMCLSSCSACRIGKRHTVYHIAEIPLKGKSGERSNSFCVFNLFPLPYRSSKEVPTLKFYSMGIRGKSTSGGGHQRDKHGSNSSGTPAASIEKQLKTLDAYFSKLQNDMNKQLNSCTSASDSETLHSRRQDMINSSSESIGKVTENIDATDDYKAETGLNSLENYFSQLSDTKKSRLPDSPADASEGNPVKIPISAMRKNNEIEDAIVEQYTFKDEGSTDDRTDSLLFGKVNTPSISTDDEASGLYLISLLAAINIAVFLFEIASPVSSEVEHLSLPLIYGAKINKLILLGEWWRLLTPMFLHSGFLHVALGCWVLLTLGTEVCKGYGPFAFFLIYILGGICGNLTSFLHTPELTVCGTGPVFAILGAWLVYQIQNKDVTSKEVSQSMFWQAVAATVLSFVLSSFGRVDNWAHLSAAVSGVIFGFLTCPSVQFDDASAKSSQKEGIALVQRQADPCKSFATFTVSILVLASLFFLYAPELQLLEWESL